MTAWAISVAGIILLTVMCDVIIPEGQTSKYIKTVSGLVAILVMISPLPALLDGSLTLDSVAAIDKEYQLDNGYLAYVYQQRTDDIEQQCILELENIGVTGAEVHILTVTSATTEVKNVTVNIQKAELNSSSKNIDIVEAIKSTLSSFLHIDKVQVTVNGKIG
jgi:stage III sporulation protein AF